MPRNVVVAISLLVALSAFLAIPSVYAQGRGDGPVIFVTSQGLYYDSIITADPLPWNPRITHTFQQLIQNDPILETEFGPGDPQYRGGRWWIDVDGSGDYNDGDLFFSCPLLGPGRAAP
jgi:hypothetical protein